MKHKAIRITKEDNYFQRFEVLKNNRTKRHRYSEFIVEGVRNVNQAIKNDWVIKSIIYSGEKDLSDWAKNIIKNVSTETIFNLSNKLMDKLSAKEDSSEIILIVEIKQKHFYNNLTNKNPLIALFDKPSNKGNLGTIIRSCDALGFDGLIVTGHCVDLYDPEVIAASVGSFLNLPTLSLDSQIEIGEFFSKMKSLFPHLKIIGTSAHGAINIFECDFTNPTILLIGNETFGLNSYFKNICDVMVKIPIGGSATSLNVACASSIVMYEIQRQRWKF